MNRIPALEPTKPAEPRVTEDFCRCGHVASSHADGEGECRTCRADRRTAWSTPTRCHRFSWAQTWELAPGAA